MKLFDSFKSNKKLLSRTQFVNVYLIKSNNKEYKIIIPKRTANRHSIIHCIEDYIAWEQAPLFPRLVGNIRGIKTPIYKFAPKKDYNTIFVIKGKPNGIICLDDGIFCSANKFNDNLINVMCYHQFKRI